MMPRMTVTGSTTPLIKHSNASNKTAIGSSTPMNAAGTALRKNAKMDQRLITNQAKTAKIHAKRLETLDHTLPTSNLT